MAVQGGLTHLQPRGERGGGDPFGSRLLQHGGQGLQDLHAALTGFGTFATVALRVAPIVVGGIGKRARHGQRLGCAGGHGQSVRRWSAGGHRSEPVGCHPFLILAQRHSPLQLDLIPQAAVGAGSGPWIGATATNATRTRRP